MSTTSDTVEPLTWIERFNRSFGPQVESVTPSEDVHTVDIGKKYYRLTVIKLIGRQGRFRKVWECLCDCGKTCKRNTTQVLGKCSGDCGCGINQDNIPEQFKREQIKTRERKQRHKVKRSTSNAHL